LAAFGLHIPILVADRPLQSVAVFQQELANLRASIFQIVMLDRNRAEPEFVEREIAQCLVLGALDVDIQVVNVFGSLISLSMQNGSVFVTSSLLMFDRHRTCPQYRQSHEIIGLK
jgi:hypothetical protein